MQSYVKSIIGSGAQLDVEFEISRQVALQFEFGQKNYSSNQRHRIQSRRNSIRPVSFDHFIVNFEFQSLSLFFVVFVDSEDCNQTNYHVQVKPVTHFVIFRSSVYDLS